MAWARGPAGLSLGVCTGFPFGVGNGLPLGRGGGVTVWWGIVCRVVSPRPSGEGGESRMGERGERGTSLAWAHHERWPAPFRAAGHRRGQGLAGRRWSDLAADGTPCVRERVGPGSLQGLVCNFGLGWKGLGFVVGLMGNCLW